MRRRSSALAALLVLTLLAPAALAGRSDVTLDLTDRPLDEALAPIRAAADVEILLDPAPPPTPITLRFDSVPWPDALDRVAAAAGLVVRPEAKRIRLVPVARVTFDFEDAELGQVVDVIVAQAKANVVRGPGVTGRITLAVKDRPWREALDLAAALAGYVVLERDTVLFLRPKDSPGAKEPGSAGPRLPRVEKKVTVRLVDEPLGEVIDWLADHVGANLVAGPAAAKETVSINVEDLPWTTVLRLLARRAGAVIETTGELVEVVKPPHVSFSFQDAEIARIVSVIAAYSGADVVFGPELRGAVSVRLNRVRWRVALDAIASEAGFAIAEDEGVLHVTTPDRAAKESGGPPMLAGVEGAVSFDLADQPLTELVEPFRSAVGVELILDGKAAEKRVTARARKLPWRQALRLVAKRSGTLLTPEGRSAVRVTAPPSVTFDFQQADVRKVVAVIGAYARITVTCGPEVTGVVTARMNDVPWPVALRAVVRAAGRTLVQVDPKTFVVR